MRVGRVERETSETHVRAAWVLDPDGTPQAECSTAVPFFDHLLSSMAYHGGFELSVTGSGDLEVDAHHLVEDVGIVLGQALREALGDCKGINRFGQAFIPMDDALVGAFLDLSGRPYLDYGLALPPRQFGCFHTDLVEEFLRALVMNSGLTLHVRQEAGSNAHHIMEACFKALGRALAAAVDLSGSTEIPSTKGSL